MQTTIDRLESRNQVINTQLEELGLAVFLTLLGVLWMLPEGYLTSTNWLVGAGIILLSINLVRYYIGIKMSGFTVFLGFVALSAVAVSACGVRLPMTPAFLIVLGLSLLIRRYSNNRNRST